MREFGDAQIGRNVPPMCTMYDSDSLDAISEIGAKIPATSLYASFVCEFNPHFVKEDFDHVYDAIEDFYFDEIQCRFIDASDNGENWLDMWRESLLD